MVKKNNMNNNSFQILALVAVVAIVAIVAMFSLSGSDEIFKESYTGSSANLAGQAFDQGMSSSGRLALKCDFEENPICYSDSGTMINPIDNFLPSGYIAGYEGKAMMSKPANKDMVSYHSNYLSEDEGTIEFWLKPNFKFSETDNYQFNTFFRYGSFNSDLLTIQTDSRSSSIIFAAKNGANGKVVSLQSRNLANSWQDTEQWHKITVTWDANTLKMYLDGIQVAGAKRIAFPDLSSFDRFYIGSGGNSLQADAAIDNFRIYDYAKHPFCNANNVCDNGNETNYYCPGECEFPYEIKGRIKAYDENNKAYDWVQGANFVQLDDDPESEIIVGFSRNYGLGAYCPNESVYEGIFKAFDLNDFGVWEELWTYDDPYETYPAGAVGVDVDDDGRDEVALAFAYIRQTTDDVSCDDVVYGVYERKQVVLLDDDGSELWKTWVVEPENENADVMFRDIEAADLISESKSPGKELILVGGSNRGRFNGGMVTVLNSLTGEILVNENINRDDGKVGQETERNWLYKLQSVEVADIDNDMLQEIVAIGGWDEYGNVHSLELHYSSCRTVQGAAYFLTEGCLKEEWMADAGHDALGLSVDNFDHTISGLELLVPSGNRYVGGKEGADRVSLLDPDGKILAKARFNPSWSAGAINDVFVIGYGISDELVANHAENQGLPRGTTKGGLLFADFTYGKKNARIIGLMDEDFSQPVLFLNSDQTNLGDGEQEYLLASCMDGTLYVIGSK